MTLEEIKRFLFDESDYIRDIEPLNTPHDTYEDGYRDGIRHALDLIERHL